MTKDIILGINNCSVSISYNEREDSGEGAYSHDLVLEFSNYTDSSFVNTIYIPCVSQEKLLELSELIRDLAILRK